MPESPPVISAVLPSSLPAALYSPASNRGFGVSSDSRPGASCFCFGNGGRGCFIGPLADLRFAVIGHLLCLALPCTQHEPCQRYAVCMTTAMRSGLWPLIKMSVV